MYPLLTFKTLHNYGLLFGILDVLKDCVVAYISWDWFLDEATYVRQDLNPVVQLEKELLWGFNVSLYPTQKMSGTPVRKLNVSKAGASSDSSWLFTNTLFCSMLNGQHYQFVVMISPFLAHVIHSCKGLLPHASMAVIHFKYWSIEMKAIE